MQISIYDLQLSLVDISSFQFHNLSQDGGDKEHIESKMEAF